MIQRSIFRVRQLADQPTKRILAVYSNSSILDRGRVYRILNTKVDSARPGPRGMKAHPKRLNSWSFIRKKKKKLTLQFTWDGKKIEGKSFSRNYWEGEKCLDLIETKKMSWSNHNFGRFVGGIDWSKSLIGEEMIKGQGGQVKGRSLIKYHTLQMGPYLDCWPKALRSLNTAEKVPLCQNRISTKNTDMDAEMSARYWFSRSIWYNSNFCSLTVLPTNR